MTYELYEQFIKVLSDRMAGKLTVEQFYTEIAILVTEADIIEPGNVSNITGTVTGNLLLGTFNGPVKL